MKLSKYNNLNKINEALTPEEIEERKRLAAESHMRMYLSKRLIDVLKTMNSPIANELINLSKKNVKFDISFMDLPKGENKDDVGKVTYIQTSKVKKLEDSGLDIKNARNSYNSELWLSNQREQPTKIGKVVKKIFKELFSNNEIEVFGNEFKAKLEKDDSKFRIVYGEEILKWYNEETYAFPGKSTLGGSCMRHSNKNMYMKFYADNGPDKKAFSHVGMLILLNDANKLLARALVWFNSVKPYLNRPRTFMDRIYYENDPQVNIFIDYAIKQNWLYKKYQAYDKPEWIDPEDNSVHNLTISFRLTPGEHKYYPFVDTVQYYTPETGRISSQMPNQAAKSKYKTLSLRNTGGAFDRVN